MGQKSIRHELVTKHFDFERDYAIITTWWRSHGSFPPKPEHLPKTGFIVEADEKAVCAGFVYRTDSSICVFEFAVSDPEADKEVRDDCLSELIKAVKEWATTNHYSLIYTSVGIPKYIKRLQEQGFIIADKKQTHIFCEIKT